MASCNSGGKLGKLSSNIKTTARERGDNLSTIKGKDYAVSLDLKNSSLVLTPEICRALLVECPQDFDIAYKPSVDVNGRPVASADLNPSTIKLPDKIRIPIAFSKVSRFTGALVRPKTAVGGAFSSQFINEIPLGFIDYELKSGNIAFNGQNLTKNESSLLRQKCRDILFKKKELEK